MSLLFLSMPSSLFNRLLLQLQSMLPVHSFLWTKPFCCAVQIYGVVENWNCSAFFKTTKWKICIINEFIKF
jgi:hypothetical protein